MRLTRAGLVPLHLTVHQPTEEQRMTDQTTRMQPDPEALRAFADRVMADVKGHQAAFMASLGDHLGLFAALAQGPATGAEISSRSGLEERQVREWLAGMTAAEYVEHHPEKDMYQLTPEQVAVLAMDDTPVSMGGTFHELAGLWAVFDEVKRSFTTGDGIGFEAYSAPLWDGMERFTNAAFQTQLLQEWVTKADGVTETLENGAPIADVGCGRGRALVHLLEAYPDATGVGYDLSAAQSEGARKLAASARVNDRVEFRLEDVAHGLDGEFDLVTSFDVVHDLADVDAVFASIHDSLATDGSWLVVDFDVAEDLKDNISPIATILYGFSLAYCVPTSLWADGDALGSCGLPPSEVRARAAKAGFDEVNDITVENPFNRMYQLK